MKPGLKIFFAFLICAIALGSCTGNKKNRCNTCPKWEDRVNPQSFEGYEK